MSVPGKNTETTDLVKIFQQFGIYRNTLPKEHNEFVKVQIQKDYDTVTKTYELQGPDLHRHFPRRFSPQRKPRGLLKGGKARHRSCFARF